MIFYVYMSPEVIQDANHGGPYAMEALIGILRGFVQNCCIFEFEDNRLQKAVFNNILQLPQDNAKKMIMVLLGELKKQRRFICHLIPNYGTENINISDVDDQAENALLDFLLAGKNEMSDVSGSVEVAALDDYNQSNFASKRSNISSTGRTLLDGELDESEFLEEVFKKAFIHTKRIEICDGIFGEKFGDNFEYSFSTLFKWLGKVLIEPDRFEKIVIYCKKPKGYRDEYMKTQLSLIKNEEQSKIKIEIRYYHPEEMGQTLTVLPHERFIITDQIALNIGRGMDFLNRHTKRNRDISINYTNTDKIAALIGAYRQYNSVDPVVL